MSTNHSSFELNIYQNKHIFSFIEIYDKCFISDEFTHTLAHKFPAPVIINDKVCGQVCVFYEDINLIRWPDDEDSRFLQNIANDFGLWLDKN